MTKKEIMDKLTDTEEAIMNEAFMMGRVYASGGEKENPADIHTKLVERCERQKQFVQLIKKKKVLF